MAHDRIQLSLGLWAQNRLTFTRPIQDSRYRHRLLHKMKPSRLWNEPHRTWTL